MEAETLSSFVDWVRIAAMDPRSREAKPIQTTTHRFSSLARLYDEAAKTLAQRVHSDLSRSGFSSRLRTINCQTHQTSGVPKKAVPEDL